jgi:50S ribosomal subunit-associated GTPase HflX
MTFPGWVKLRLERRRLERRIAQLEEDLDRIRSETLKRTEPNPTRQSTGPGDLLDE